MATTAAAIAKATRTEIAAARTAGTITLPEGAKLRIRASNFAGGCAVGVYVEEVDRAWAITTRDGAYGEVAAPTAEAKAIGDALTGILRRNAAGRCWGDVTIAGLAVDGGTISPSHWRPGQD